MERTDNARFKRVELHAHSNMSEMDGVTPAAALIMRALEWGHKAVAITDSGNVCAYPEMMRAVERLRENSKNIKVIYGMEAYFVNDSDPSDDINGLPVYCISILVKNKQGLKNLYKLVSLSDTKYLRRIPRIPLTVLREHREGLLIGSGCSKGELFRALLDEKARTDIDKLAAFYDYFEIQPTEDEKLKAVNKKITELADRHGKLCAAVGDVRFKDKEDAILHKIIRLAAGNVDTNEQAFFKTTEEMLDEFEYLGEEKAFEVVVTNTNAIADMTDDDLRPFPEGMFAPSVPEAEKEFKELCRGRAKELYGEKLPRIVEDRLERELWLISKKGYSGIYYAAHKLVKYSEENGYHVGARGGVGSSLAAFLLGITEVNPLPPHYLCPKCRRSEFITDGAVYSGYDFPRKNCPNCGEKMTGDGQDIPYETFMGVNGEKKPVIALNISGEIGDKVYEYAEELFGKGQVVKGGVISDVYYNKARTYVKNYCQRYGLTCDEAEIERLTLGCEGVKYGQSCHPATLLIIPKGYDVYDFTPIRRPSTVHGDEGLLATHFDYRALENTLLRLEMPADNVPTVFRRLEDMTGVKISDVPMDDPIVYKLFSSKEPLDLKEGTGSFCGLPGTIGINEFSTDFTINMLSSTRARTFSDLIVISGFFHGDAVRIGGEKEPGIDAPEIIAARDDVMMYLTRKGLDPKMAYRIMELVRKGRGGEFDESMYDAFRLYDIPDRYVEAMKKTIYLVPKAHIAAYVTAAVKLAWFKIYRPAEFYAALLQKYDDEIRLNLDMLRSDRQSMIKRIYQLVGSPPGERGKLEALRLILELKSRGINLLPISVFSSEAVNYKVEGGKIRPPLHAVKECGVISAQKIKEAVDKFGCKTPDEILQKVEVSDAAIEALREAGAFDEIP